MCEKLSKKMRSFGLEAGASLLLLTISFRRMPFHVAMRSPLEKSETARCIWPTDTRFDVTPIAAKLLIVSFRL